MKDCKSTCSTNHLLAALHDSQLDEGVSLIEQPQTIYQLLHLSWMGRLDCNSDDGRSLHSQTEASKPVPLQGAATCDRTLGRILAGHHCCAGKPTQALAGVIPCNTSQ